MREHIVMSKHAFCGFEIRERHGSKFDGTGDDSILIIISIHGDDLAGYVDPEIMHGSPQGVTKCTGLSSLANPLVRPSVRKIAVACLWQCSRRAPMRK